MDSNKKSDLVHKNCVTILGSGTSTGVPTPGCPCEICQQAIKAPGSKNYRLRTSIIIKTKNGNNILVDTTPDLRTQILSNNITKISAAIITHDHADHIHGIDDLRPFCFFQTPREIPLFTTEYTKTQLEKRFEYIFDNKKKIIGGGIPLLTLNTIKDDLTQQSIIGEEFTFFALPHGHITTTGFYHEGLVYLTDCQSIPEDVLEFLASKEIKLLIIDTTRRKPHATHLHLDKSIEYIKKINPIAARLIHLSHDFDHETLTKEIQDLGLTQTLPAYDQEMLLY